MLALSAPADKAIRAQVAEAVSLIAELDFPVKWETLIDVCVVFVCTGHTMKMTICLLATRFFSLCD